MLPRPWAFLAGAGAFLLNPTFACGSAEPDYQYGEAELRAAVEGDWALTVTHGPGAALELSVRLQQRAEHTASARAPSAPAPSLLRSAHACGTRTLLAPAHACIDSTEMPLAVSLLAGGAGLESAALSGNFRVDSLVFDVGTLHLTLGELRVTAQLDAQGNVSSAVLESAPAGSATLQRLAR